MEQDKESKLKEEKSDESVRIETVELVNGDIADRSLEQSEDHSHPHTDRTGTESNTENSESGEITESDNRNEERSTHHKVCYVCYVC